MTRRPIDRLLTYAGPRMAHRHPDLAGDCVHGDEPSRFPDWLVIAIGVVAILVAVGLVGVAFIALAGPGQ